MSLSPKTPIENLYLVGESYADRLKKFLNIHTIEDLLNHFPFRYDDLTSTKKISEITEGETVTLQGQIISIENINTKARKQIQKAVFSDGTDLLNITWFNQPYLLRALQTGTLVNLAGSIKLFAGKPTMVSPKYEVVKQNFAVQTDLEREIEPNADTTHTGRLVPIYNETYGVTSKWLRARIKPLLKQVDELITDWLPQEIKESLNLADLPEAIEKIHFPQSMEDMKIARRRLEFDELFLMQLKTQEKIKNWQNKTLRHRLKIDEQLLEVFYKSLPFTLTDDQQNALSQILTDLQGTNPMNRLLEGDVGSGKTVVAAAAIYGTYMSNGQASFDSAQEASRTKPKIKSILIAPTEVLAQQHKKNLEKLLQPLGMKIGFFTGSEKSVENIKDYDLYLGTHALLFQDLPHEEIGLVIIDEQHRFGVQQRGKLLGHQEVPHVLSMTATPIPRTVALSLYGDLALSTINTMPLGRKAIKTWVVPAYKREAAFEWIKKQMKETKSQCYIIYPLIDKSDSEAMTNIKAATDEFEIIKENLPDFKIGLLHGRMKPKEKNEIMKQFASHELDVLVSTSVIEVGIDVPNATIIVIEGAERFGLSQLHQLRGRVGRGDKQSFCLLFTTSKKNEDSQRLKALEKHTSGLKLAEIDLKLRGPGEMYGTQQSGFAEFKIATLNDHQLLSQTQDWAKKIFPRISEFDALQEKLHQSTIDYVQPN